MSRRVRLWGVLDCRVGRRTAPLAFDLEGGAPSIALDVHLEDGGMVNQAIRCVTYGGTIVILGFAARHGVMEEVKMNRLLLKGITVVGYRFGESGRRFPRDLEVIWDGYLRMVTEGKLQPLLYGQYEGLESIGRALKDLAERKVCGKIVVSVTEKSRL